MSRLADELRQMDTDCTNEAADELDRLQAVVDQQNTDAELVSDLRKELADANNTIELLTDDLRDYFAAAALAHVPKLLDVQGLNLTVAMISEWSYEIADAMIAERERKHT